MLKPERWIRRKRFKIIANLRMKNAFYRRHCESASHGDFILMNLNGGRGNLPICNRPINIIEFDFMNL